MSKRIDKILDAIDQALDEAAPWAAGNQSSDEASYGGPGGGCIRCNAPDPEPSGWCSTCHPRNDEMTIFEVLEAFGCRPRADPATLALPPDFRPVARCLCDLCAEARRRGLPERDPDNPIGDRPSAMTVYAPGVEPPAPFVLPGRRVTIERLANGCTLVTDTPDIPEADRARAERMRAEAEAYARAERWRRMVAAGRRSGLSFTGGDMTNLEITTPHEVTEVAGIDRAAMDRLELLGNFSITLEGVFNNASEELERRLVDMCGLSGPSPETIAEVERWADGRP